MLNSVEECSIKASRAALERVDCSENRLFKPFSNPQAMSGAVVSGSVSLVKSTSIAPSQGFDQAISSNSFPFFS